MADQRIQGINAIAIARGTSEPTNTDVLWLDDNIEGNIYTRLKVYVEGSWELISRVPSQVLDDLRSVDGAGSGLDADTLRGYTPEQLIEAAGGEGVPDLGVGELLVGQTDNTGVAKTVGGIVTMDANGNMLYVTNSISHTGLTDVGTNTHAQIDSHISDGTIHFTEGSIDHTNIQNVGTNTHSQIDSHISDSTIHFTEGSIDHTNIQNVGTNTHTQIDSHISSTSNPHGVTAGQVGNTVSQWNADKIEGNTTNIGSLGAAQDGQVMIWDNATSRFIMGAAGAENLNDLTDVNTGLPVPTTEADTGKILYYDHSSGEWKTDEAVTHGTVVINGKKDSAGTIAKGLPVYLVGFDSDLHTVELADANNASAMPVIGFSAESMNNTDSKHIITFGKLEGVDTTSTVSQLNPNGETWAVNDVLYISTNTGGLTKVRPTGSGSLIQRVAKVLKVHGNGGQIFIFNTARTAGLPNLTTDNVWVGDVNGYPQMVNKSTLGGNSIYTADGTIGSGRIATLTDTLTYNATNIGGLQDPYIEYMLNGGFEILATGTDGAIKVFDSRIANTNIVFNVGRAVNSNGTWNQQNIKIGKIVDNDYLEITASSFNFIDGGTVRHKFTGTKAILSGNALIGTEDISLQGETVIKGDDTLSTSTALAIYDGDATPNKLWDFRNNGDIVLGQSSIIDLDNNNLRFTNARHVEIVGLNNQPAFKVLDHDGTTEFFKIVSGTPNYTENRGTSILGIRNTANRIEGSKNNLSFFNTSAVLEHFINISSSGATGEYFTLFRNGFTTTKKKFIIGASTLIGTEQISLQGETLIDGTLDMNNNRITNTVVNPSVQETASTATFTINADEQTDGVLTAMAAATTIAAPTGSPVQSQNLIFRFKDDGTARAITWNAIFRAIGVTLPTTTTANKTLYVGCKYNSTDTKWDVIAVKEEA